MLLLTLFLGLEVLIAYLQAYIFTFITCITIKDMTVGLLFIESAAIPATFPSIYYVELSTIYYVEFLLSTRHLMALSTLNHY